MAIVEICTAPLAAKNAVNFSRTVAAPKFAPLRAAPASVKPVQEKAASTGAPISVTSDQIMEKWNEVLAKVKQYNHSLSFILRVCQPRNLTGDQLCLAFKYKFHRDRVSEIAIKNIIEKVLNQVYNAQIHIEAVVDENLEVAATKLVSDEPPDMKKPPEPPQGEQGNMIDNLLKTFGGKVVS
jgi:hypothetical protein